MYDRTYHLIYNQARSQIKLLPDGTKLVGRSEILNGNSYIALSTGSIIEIQ